MGDGHAIAYTGAIRKETIEADSLDEAFERLHEDLPPASDGQAPPDEGPGQSHLLRLLRLRAGGARGYSPPR